MSEEYRTIDAYPGYMFSETGAVLSLARVDAGARLPTDTGAYRLLARSATKARICKPFAYAGQWCVSLKLGGSYTRHRVADLIALAWLGDRPDGARAALIDPAKPPVLSNLFWLLKQSDSAARAAEIAKARHERARRNATLREMHGQGHSDADIARTLHISTATVARVIGKDRCHRRRVDATEVLRLWHEGLRKVDIQCRMKISEGTVHRILKDYPSPRR
ncbi:hypothetical protein [Rhizobium sp. Rhizsp82]|uniref:hypothetical protein n=1 Tax=Rhizobium sp. Rhizsp82 TaxID=3243057 RepID=UPI0039B3ADE6